MIRSDRALICHRCHALHAPSDDQRADEGGEPEHQSRSKLHGSASVLQSRASPDHVFASSSGTTWIVASRHFLQEPVQGRALQQDLPSGPRTLSEDHVRDPFALARTRSARQRADPLSREPPSRRALRRARCCAAAPPGPRLDAGPALRAASPRTPRTSGRPAVRRCAPRCEARAARRRWSSYRP